MNTIAIYLIAAVVLVIVHTEVYAATRAVLYAMQLKNKTLSQRIYIGYLRYEWASMVFHEVYCGEAGIKPAYRVLPTMLACLAIVLFGAIADAYRVGVGVEVFIAGALAFGGAYFTVTYGKAFTAWRNVVAHGGTQETWKFA